MIDVKSDALSDKPLDVSIILSELDTNRFRFIQGAMLGHIIRDGLKLDEPTDDRLCLFLMKVGLRSSLDTILREIDIDATYNETK